MNQIDGEVFEVQKGARGDPSGARMGIRKAGIWPRFRAQARND